MVFGMLNTPGTPCLGEVLGTHSLSNQDWIVLLQIVHGRKLFLLGVVDTSGMKDQIIDL